MDKIQEILWDVLCELSGEQVATLFTQWHGMQLLDTGFLTHLVDEGFIIEEEGLND